MVLLFAEKRRQYNAEQNFMELRNTFDNSIQNVNLFIIRSHDPEYSLGPFDIGTKHNKNRIKQLCYTAFTPTVKLS